MNNEGVRRILLGAKSAISNGWTQGTLRDWQGNVCLFGGLHVGCGWTASERLPIRSIRENADDLNDAADELIVTAGFLKSPYDGLDTRLSAWNDAPGRTVEEVIDLIDRTLARIAEPAAQEAVHA